MLNFTLTITAAPELLSVLSNFTNSIKSAKVVTIAETNPEFTGAQPGPAIDNQSEQQTCVFPTQSSTQLPIQNSPQLPIQHQIPVNSVPIHNQNNAVPVRQVQAPPAQPSIVPTSTQVYTMEQLAVAATQLVDTGRRTELVALLSSFGVQALTALPKEQYGAFATQLRKLGSKI